MGSNPILDKHFFYFQFQELNLTTAALSGVLGTAVVGLLGLSGWLGQRLRRATRAAEKAKAEMAALKRRIGNEI